MTKGNDIVTQTDLSEQAPEAAQGQEAGPGETITFEPNAGAGERTIHLGPDIQTTLLDDMLSGKVRNPFRQLDVKGKSNRLSVGPDTALDKVMVLIKGHNNRIIIGRHCQLRGSIAITGSNRIVFIGAYSSFNQVAIVCKHGGHVYIGRDCMFSSSIEIRTSDSHAIIDLETNRRQNAAAGVFIGDHVWLGKRVTVSKGVYLADDNIVGFGSFVQRSFPQSATVIAGTPARVVREKKSWARNELIDPATSDIYAWRQLALV